LVNVLEQYSKIQSILLKSIMTSVTKIQIYKLNSIFTGYGDDRRVDHRTNFLASLFAFEGVIISTASGMIERNTSPLVAIIAPLGLQ